MKMIILNTYLPLMLISWGLTGLLRRYALQKNVLDIPNKRSSHIIPTPRGGGLAFVVCFLITLVFFTYSKQIDPSTFIAIIVPALIIAILGFYDDHYNLSAISRLIGHTIAAGFVVFWFNDVNALSSINSNKMLILTNIGCITYLVWFINLFNFMDGIDGLAAIETITVCAGGALLYIIAGQEQAIILPLLLTCAVSGFLIWNYPPARIFMGDVGSGFLGLIIGIFSLFAARIDSSLFYGWFILNGVFFCDASITLLRRLWRKENIFKAHCSHAYQQAARRYNSHKLISLIICAINCCWLLPIAILVQQKIFIGLIGVIIAFAPLIALVLKFNAKDGV